MAINMMCSNSDCKYYWEDNCIQNINEKRIVIDSNGQCKTFEKGKSDWYKIEKEFNEPIVHITNLNGIIEDNGELKLPPLQK